LAGLQAHMSAVGLLKLQGPGSWPEGHRSLPRAAVRCGGSGGPPAACWHCWVLPLRGWGGWRQAGALEGAAACLACSPQFVPSWRAPGGRYAEAARLSGCQQLRSTTARRAAHCTTGQPACWPALALDDPGGGVCSCAAGAAGGPVPVPRARASTTSSLGTNRARLAVCCPAGPSLLTWWKTRSLMSDRLHTAQVGP
jgi:hypothetical protein